MADLETRSAKPKRSGRVSKRKLLRDSRAAYWRCLVPQLGNNWARLDVCGHVNRIRATCESCGSPLQRGDQLLDREMKAIGTITSSYGYLIWP